MFRKLITMTVVLTTIAWTMGAAVFVPVASAVTLSAGDLIKASSAAVYYYAADGKRYTFPTQSTYMSWYSDFDGVKTITDDELAAIDLAGNVVMRPGTNLVKITTVPKVFAVAPNGMLYHIADATVAESLYGANWMSLVKDIPDGFWTNYTDSGEQLDGTTYPEGALVKEDGGSDIYYVNADGSWSMVEDMDAFDANMFNSGYVMTAPAAMTYTSGSAISAGMSDLIDVSQGGGAGAIVTDNTLEVSLNSATPAAAVIPADVPVEFVSFDFMAGAEDVNVTSLKLTAGGLGTSTYVDNVTVYAGGSKVGTSGNINSDGYRTFNFATPVSIPAGTTKVFTVKAQIEASQSGYFNLGVAAAADVTSSADSVSGSFPVTGNTMNSTGSSVTVGALTLDADDLDTTEDVGADELTLVEFTGAASSTEDINFTGLTLKNNGTLRGSNVGTLSLYHDDVLLDTALMDDDKYVSFSFDTVTIEKGDTENFKVVGDLESGDSGDTMQLYIKDDTDVVATGARYGHQVSVTKTAFDTDDADSTTITLQAGELVINFNKTEVPAANIQVDTDNIVMGQLELTASSEAVKITALDFGVTGPTAGEVENPELVNLDTGGIIDLDSSYDTDEEIYIAAGDTATFNFRLDTTSTADNDDVYYVTLASAGITAEGETSGVAITNITPSSIASKNMTVVAAGLTHDVVTLNSVTTIGGAENIPVYKATLKASTSSGIKITRFTLTDAIAGNTGSFHDSDITKLSLVIDDTVVKTHSNKITESTTAVNTMTFDGFSYVVPAGETQTMYFKADFADTLTYAGAFTVAVSAITAKDDANDTVSVTPDTTAGPSVTPYSAGLLDVYGSNSESLANRTLYVVGGETSGLVGALKFDAQREDVKVKDLVLYVVDNADAGSDVESVSIIDDDGSTVLATSQEFDYGDYDGDTDTNDMAITFDDWNYIVDETGMKTVYLSLVTKEIGIEAEQTGTSGEALTVSIYSVTAEGDASGDTITVTGNATPASGDSNNYFDNDYVTNALGNVGLNVTSVTSGLSNGVLTNGQVVIGKFNFTFDTNGNTDSSGVAAKFFMNSVHLDFGVTGAQIGDGAGLADYYVYWASDPNTKVTVSDFQATSTGEDANLDLTSLAGVNADDTLVIEAADLSGAGTAGDYVQMKLDWSTAADFTWDDNIAANITGLRLPYTSVVSGTLSN